MITIELDIFSGRPNPTWTVDGADEQVLLQRLAVARPGAPGAWDVPLPLGYRGFLVYRANIERVYQSIPGLEEWLLETGKTSLDPVVYQRARTALGLP